MDHIPFIGSEFMDAHTNFKLLIRAIHNGFAARKIETPMRHHHDYANPREGKDSTLLLMPSWEAGNDLGVKVVSVNPNNGKYNLPAIQGTYLYLDGNQGNVKAIFDAKALTAIRTAATSALASSLLAPTNASSLLVLGTGALSTRLIKAHSCERPIKEVFVWGRNRIKAERIAEQSDEEQFQVVAIENYLEKMSRADIISCATLSKNPLVFGNHLRAGQHLDLIGSYKKDMREADDEAIRRSSIFLDTFEGGLKESGDIVIPIQSGVLKEHEIKADLFDLCSGSHKGRQSEQEITFFKSVGHASEDLIAARYFYEQWCNSEYVK